MLFRVSKAAAKAVSLQYTHVLCVRCSQALYGIPVRTTNSQDNGMRHSNHTMYAQWRAGENDAVIVWVCMLQLRASSC